MASIVVLVKEAAPRERPDGSGWMAEGTLKARDGSAVTVMEFCVHGIFPTKQSATEAVNRIPDKEYERMLRRAKRDKTAENRTELKARLSEAERFVGGRKGSPIVQGGLPSLGKTR